MKIGNQEVETALSTPLDYNLVRWREEHLFSNESYMLHSGSAAGWQVAVLALNNRWLAEDQCPVMFILEFVRAGLFVLLVKETVMQLYGVHREAQSRQSSSLLALVGCAVINSRDLSEWQIGRIDYVNQRGAPSTADLAHMAGRVKSGAVAAQEECPYKCCHSDGVLGLMLLSDSTKSRRPVPVEKNIGFTTMRVK